MTERPTCATTADYIAFHAADRPGAAALIDNGRAISYAELGRDIGKFTAALGDFGLAPGSRVAIGCANLYVHWLLLAACERLGIVSASYVDEGGAATPLLSGVDLVLAEPGFPIAGARRHYVVATPWLEDVFARTGADADLPPGAPEDAVRIASTSGTTGTIKRLILTRRMCDAWIDRWRWSLGITRNTRFLLTMSFGSTGRYMLTNAVLRSGGTVVLVQFVSIAAVADAIAAHGINLLTLLPIQLKQVLDGLPPDFTKPARLTLATIGAAISDSLIEKAMQRLATEMIAYYGSNEIPFIAETRMPTQSGMGTLFPWVEAEVVDDAGRPLPHGAVGWIRLKADTMAARYLDDPETTSRMFREGWFYPGDVGILGDRRHLQVMGRGDELLNIGGYKMAPSGLEALVARHAEAADVGVCGLRNAVGVEEICVGVVAPVGDDSELSRRVARAFEGLQFGTVRLVKLPAIPRNANGKILRAALKEAVAARLLGSR